MMPHAAGRSHHTDLVRRCRGLAPIVTAVVHPCDRLSLEGAIACADAGLIVPILVGNPEKVAKIARDASLDVTRFESVTAAHSHAAAAAAAELARDGRVEALMKGSLHSDELLHEVTRADSGLHTERRISHVWVMDLPNYSQPLIVTDAVVNVSPTLHQKRDIVQNAVDCAHALAINDVRVAIVSAIETVSEEIPSTVDAAALSKMAERGQITGAIVDGPLALDDAISLQAAAEKGLSSPVAGRANILVVPDFEAGNMLAKSLILLSGGAAAGIVVGARVPIILTSRADAIAARLASAAAALLLVRYAPAAT